MLTKTLSEAKKKQRNILIKAMNNDIGSIDSAKDSWNPAQISERAKDISYIRSLVDTWNPAQLNEALRMLDLPVIDTWNPAQIEEQRRNLVFYLAERTLTGNPITLNIIGNLSPEVTGLKVSMLPIQDLNGYDRPWPGGGNINKAYGVLEGYTIDATGNVISGSGYNVILAHITEDEEYTFSIDGEATAATIAYFESEPEASSQAYDELQHTGESTFTAPITGYVGIVCDNTVTKYQVEQGNTASSWLPYSNICPIIGRSEVTVTRTAGEDVETKTHTYTDTIYGGVDDFVNGECSVTYAIVDLGTLTYTYNSTYDYFITYTSTLPSGNIKYVGNYWSTKFNGLCEEYDVTSKDPINNPDANMFICCDGSVNNVSQLQIRNKTYTDPNAFKTAMDGVQLCYELATPTTITTSAEEITLLRGTNVLSTDGNSIELKYKQNF